MSSKIRKHFALMVESFKDAGVIDGGAVEQDTEDEKDETGDSKVAVDNRPMNFWFCFVSSICITSVRLRSPRDVDWRLVISCRKARLGVMVEILAVQSHSYWW